MKVIKNILLITIALMFTIQSFALIYMYYVSNLMFFHLNNNDYLYIKTFLGSYSYVIVSGVLIIVLFKTQNFIKSIAIRSLTNSIVSIISVYSFYLSGQFFVVSCKGQNTFYYNSNTQIIEHFMFFEIQRALVNANCSDIHYSNNFLLNKFTYKETIFMYALNGPISFISIENGYKYIKNNQTVIAK